jgi:2-iminobutanoate/2-iminopropanoate deaminase
MKEIVQTKNAPAAIGPYSQGIKIGTLVFTAGQIGVSPTTGELVQGGVTAETERALLNIGAVLDAAGSSLQNVVKTTVFLKDLQDFQQMNSVYEQFFGDSLPARSTVQAIVPKGANVEIEAIAAIE